MSVKQRWYEQGKIGTAKRNDGTEQEIHVYANSSDFPNFHIIIMTSAPIPQTSVFYERSETKIFPTERVPINEDIWREIGKSLGYKFVVRKKKTEG